EVESRTSLRRGLVRKTAERGSSMSANLVDGAACRGENVGMTTGELIKMYRTRRNLKQRQLAIASGTSFSYMSEIEADKRKPSMNKLEQIAAALDVNPRALLEDAVSPALIRWYVLED